MRKIRYYIRLFWAFILRFKKIILLSSIVGVIVFFLTRLLFSSIWENKVERIGINGRYFPEELPNEILILISEGLTSVKHDKTVEPALAESWETPDKGKTWIFKVNKNKTWQTGEKVISADIKVNFTDVEVEKPDDLTVVFKLKNAYSPFPSVVSKPVFKKGLLGTGDWKVDKIILAGNYVQELVLKNNNQQNKEGRLLKAKKVYKFYPTQDRTKLAYKLGEVDEIQNVLDKEPFEDWKNTIFHEKTDKDQIVTIFFRNTDPVLSSKQLRQALFYAIDKTKFYGQRATSPISPDSWAFNPQVKRYQYDPERARELIEDLDENGKNDLKLRLVTSPVLLESAEKIAEYWREVGVETTVLVTSIIPEDFQAYLTIFDAPDDPDQYSIWHSTQKGSNISDYSNPRIDKLLEDGRMELDIEERHKIYLDFQRFLLEDAPAAFLYHPTLYTIKRR